MTDSAYASAGVDAGGAGRGVAALVGVLRTIDTGREQRSLLGSGHYASVLRLAGSSGLVLSTDGVGTKLIVAEEMGRFDTVGIDCIAMNVNDVVCVGADPIALLDYIAVEEARDEVLEEIGRGLKAGAEDAGVEIPGGELAVVPELIRGHPSPTGIDLVGMCVGLVDLDDVISGDRVKPGDAIIGLPSSGVHSNGYTLARRALPALDEAPAELAGATVGETLLEPTVIYVRAVRALLASGLDVRGLAHITGDGLLNLTRLHAKVGYRIDSPLPVPPVFELIGARAGVDPAEMWQVFNMGCGFCCVVPSESADQAVALLAERHPGAGVIGEATDRAGHVELPFAGLAGRAGEGFAAV
ncbi:MAG TPA: phosphoribosylformylglycinamidine cyclo-ligase [Thermoleophilaceae bacterium]|nr:phosphoribosylformylglycinamidine cyclo-ligase [Thermoleophilaceae bacterium]